MSFGCNSIPETHLEIILMGFITWLIHVIYNDAANEIDLSQSDLYLYNKSLEFIGKLFEV